MIIFMLNHTGNKAGIGFGMYLPVCIFVFYSYVWLTENIFINAWNA